MSDNMPGVKSAELIMSAINKLTPNIEGKAFEPDWFMLRHLIEASLTDARRRGMTEAINHLKLRQLANQESCVAMLETARDNIK